MNCLWYLAAWPIYGRVFSLLPLPKAFMLLAFFLRAVLMPVGNQVPGRKEWKR